MLKVHVCEDNKEQQKNLEQCIEEVIAVENLKMEKGIITDNPGKMLEGIKQEKETGVFFLDIDLNHDMNGVELARKLREYQPRCYIIFVTTHSEMSYMTFSYKVEAMDFIIKDNLKEIKNRVHQCLVHAEELQKETVKETRKTYSVKQGEKIKEIPYDDILFFEAVTSSRKILLHTKNMVMEFNGRIKEIEGAMDERFYRCHRGFIVNKNNIEEVNEEERMIYLYGGESCPMSVRLGKGIVK